MMRTRTLFVSLLAGVAAMAGAQWSQLHGNAQHNGYAGVPLPDSFQLAWETDLGGPIVSSPVTGPDGTIYVGPVREDTLETPSVAIYAVNPDGSVKWKFRTPFIEDETFTLPTPAVGPDGTIYIGALNGVFYALNPTGSVKWQKQGDYPVLQSAAVAPNGNVYVGLDGRLNAFSPAGTLLWQAPMGDPRLSGGPALATDGTIYSAYAQQDVEVKLVALNPNGSSKWEYPLSLYFWPLGAPVVGQDGSIYVTDTSLHAINPDGTNKWLAQPTYGMQGIGSPAVDPQGNVYYGTSNYIWKFDNQGQVLWSHTITTNNSQLGHIYGSVVVDSRGQIYTGFGNGKRNAIEAEKRLVRMTTSGTVASTFVLPEISGFSSFAVTPGGSLYIGSLDGKLRKFNGGAEPGNLSNFTLSAPSTPGGGSLTGSVFLSGAAPSGGTTVALASSSSVIQVPSTVVVPAGQNRANFTVSTSAVGGTYTRAITASLRGVTKTASLTVTPSLASLSMPAKVDGGSQVTGTVNLFADAPSGGAVVSIQSNTSALQVPASVTIPAGARSATFTITASTVGTSYTRSITASYGGLAKTASTTIEPGIALSSLSLASSTVQGGQSSTGTVTLASPAPSGGVVVRLSDNTSAITVPDSVTVAAGATSATFSYTTTRVGSTYTRSITATLNGVAKHANVTLTP